MWVAAIAMVAMSVMQAVSQKREADYNASVAKTEGKQAMLNATAEAERTRQKNSLQQSAAIANAGAQGTGFEGSPMLAFLENAQQSELESQDILFGGKLKKQQADTQASIYKTQGKNALVGGIVGGMLKGLSMFGGGMGGGAAGGAAAGGASMGSSLLTSGGGGTYTGGVGAGGFGQLNASNFSFG